MKNNVNQLRNWTSLVHVSSNCNRSTVALHCPLLFRYVTESRVNLQINRIHIFWIKNDFIRPSTISGKIANAPTRIFRIAQHQRMENAHNQTNRKSKQIEKKQQWVARLPSFLYVGKTCSMTMANMEELRSRLANLKADVPAVRPLSFQLPSVDGEVSMEISLRMAQTAYQPKFRSIEENSTRKVRGVRLGFPEKFCLLSTESELLFSFYRRFNDKCWNGSNDDKIEN